MAMRRACIGNTDLDAAKAAAKASGAAQFFSLRHASGISTRNFPAPTARFFRTAL
jgi:hypothetical protein